MKQSQIIQVLAQDFKTTDLAILNKLLGAKDAPALRYRISGKKVGHLGFTGRIKNLAADGIKVFDVNKVSLIKYSDIEKFEKAKPKVPRVRVAKPDLEETKNTALSVRGPAKAKTKESEYDNAIPLASKSRPKPTGKAGSAFIPKNTSKKK